MTQDGLPAESTTSQAPSLARLFPTLAARYKLFEGLQRMLFEIGKVQDKDSSLVDESCLFTTELHNASWKLRRQSDGLEFQVQARMADIRLAWWIPAALGLSIADMDSCSAYASDQSDKPLRTWRLLPDGRLYVEYTYSNKRFADLVLYSRAMTGDTQALGLIIDGVAFESLHLYGSFLDRARQKGYSLERRPAELVKLRFRTTLELHDLCLKLEVAPNELECLEQGTLISPFGLWQISSTQRAIDLIKTAIEEEPKIFQRENRMRVTVRDDGRFEQVRREQPALSDRPPLSGGPSSQPALAPPLSPASGSRPSAAMPSFPDIDVDQIGIGRSF